MSVAAISVLSPAETVMAYHARTKHSLKRYAAGPETLDWDMQPNPFREFKGCARTELQLGAGRLGASFAQACTQGGVAATALTIESVASLLQLSMGLSAGSPPGKNTGPIAGRCAAIRLAAICIRLKPTSSPAMCPASMMGCIII
jgi:hypothetical protein